MSNPHVTIGDFNEAAAPSSKRTSLGLDSFAADSWGVYGPNGEFNSEGRSSPLIMAKPISAVDGNEEKLKPWIGEEVYKNIANKESSCFVTPNKSIMTNNALPNINVGNGVQCDKMSECVKSLCKGLVNWNVDEKNTDVPLSDSTFTVSENDLFLYATAKAYRDVDWKGKLTLYLDYEQDNWPGIKLNDGFGLLLNIVPATNIAAGMDGNGSISATATTQGNATSPDFQLNLKMGDVEIMCNSTTAMQVKIKGGDEVAYDIALPNVQGKSAPQQAASGNGLKTIGFRPCWNGLLVSVKGGNKYVCRKYSNKTPAYYIMQKTGEIKQGDDINLDPIRLPDEDGGENFYPDFGTQFKMELKNCVASFAIVPEIVVNAHFDSCHLLLENSDSDANYKYETVSITAGVDADNSNFTTGDEVDEASGMKWGKCGYDLNISKAEIYGQVIQTVVDTRDHYRNSNGTFNFSVSGDNPQGDGGDWKKYITSVQVSCGLQGSSGSITVDGLGYAGTGVFLKQSIGGISISAFGGFHTNGGTIFKGLAMGIGVNTSSSGTELSIPLVGVEKKLQDMALINPPFMDGWSLAKACNYLFGYAGIGHSGGGTTKLSATTEMTKAIFDWKSGTSVEQALNDVMLDTHHTYAIIDGRAKIYELDDSGLPTVLGPDRRSGKGYTEITTYDQTPDFEDLRNYCVGMGIMAQTASDNGMSYLPIIIVDQNSTTPSIPWAKIWAQARPGYTSAHAGGTYNGSLDQFVDNMKKSCKRYHLTGRVTIEGDSSIKPYDKWGEYVIYSVSHSIDLQSKQWTTSFELMRSGGGSIQSGPGAGGGLMGEKKY